MTTYLVDNLTMPKAITNMKTIAAITALSALALSGFSQGQIDFQNAFTSGLYINNTADSADKVTSAPLSAQPFGLEGGVVDVGLYWSTAAFIFPYQGTLADVVTMSSTPGMIAGGTVVLPGTSGGQSVYVQVYAWDSTYANPAAAVAAGAFFVAWSAGPANTVYGAIGAAELVGNVTVSPGPPNSIFGTGAGQFGKALYVSPEPTTLVLGSLGVAGLWLIRRRK